MGIEKAGKLNRLQRELPEGLVVTAAWLTARGYSHQLTRKYVAHGWLERPAQGVYRRPGGRLTWEQVVISLQTLLQFPVLVGGRSALDLQGFAHSLQFNLQSVRLTGPHLSPAPRSHHRKSDPDPLRQDRLIP